MFFLTSAHFYQIQIELEKKKGGGGGGLYAGNTSFYWMVTFPQQGKEGTFFFIPKRAHFSDGKHTDNRSNNRASGKNGDRL